MGIEWANFWVNFTLAIITFLAVIVALFQQKFWEWWNRPIIKVGFGDKEPYVIDFYDNDRLTLLFKLEIVNLGKTVAKKCRVKIISAVSEDDKKKTPLIHEPDVLKWSSAPKDMRYYESNKPIHREHLDINPKEGWEFCDLFMINSKEKRITFSSTGSRNFMAEKENYLAVIEISGENFEPVKKQIKFSVPYKADWKKSAAILAEILEVKNISQ